MRMEGGSDPETDETITTTLHPHSLLRGLHTFFGFELWCGSFLEECGKDEIMEIISLNITLTGETEPNVELGHLLAIKMEVVRKVSSWHGELSLELALLVHVVVDNGIPQTWAH
ncbi:hypothetical protein V6N11_080318 [Hibiscus sabdariffa]|uniref:Uncharacterized protein n=1 Tax=Hibiscus sabdariffa TaxID=183260 RepID=A0ABR2R7P4_9ROSI